MATQPTPLQFLASTKNEKTGTALTSPELATRTLHRRAIEAVIWGTPAVNFDLMYQAMVRDAKSGDDSNKIVYWSRLFDWKNQTLTPNPDAIYFMVFFFFQAEDGIRDGLRRPHEAPLLGRLQADPR